MRINQRKFTADSIQHFNKPGLGISMTEKNPYMVAERSITLISQIQVENTVAYVLSLNHLVVIQNTRCQYILTNVWTQSLVITYNTFIIFYLILEMFFLKLTLLK